MDVESQMVELPAAVGSIEIRSDDLLGSTPAEGATTRLITMGTGSGTVHADLV